MTLAVSAFPRPAAQSLLIRDERPHDFFAREALLDAGFGPNRAQKTSERLREDRLPAHGLALSATEDGRLAGTLRLWHVEAGSVGASLLLGPLAVAENHRRRGLGARLMGEALHRALVRGHRSVLLVGDLAYYERFGFSRALTEGLDLPGPVDRARFLGLELQEGALYRARGMVRAAGVTFDYALAA